LTQLLTETSSPNPRWLVRFDAQMHKDEELYEHTFGKVIESASAASGGENKDVEAPIGGMDVDTAPYDDNNVAGQGMSAAKPAAESPTITTRKSANNKRSASSSSSNTGAASGEELAEDGIAAAAADLVDAKKTSTEKGATLSAQDSANNSADDSSSTSSQPEVDSVTGKKLSKVSAREARSRRRQAKIDVVGGSGSASGGGGKRPAGKSGNGGKNNKRARVGGNNTNSKECVKIKFLTGTLYIYKGTHRHVEFIRKA